MEQLDQTNNEKSQRIIELTELAEKLRQGRVDTTESDNNTISRIVCETQEGAYIVPLRGGIDLVDEADALAANGQPPLLRIVNPEDSPKRQIVDEHVWVHEDKPQPSEVRAEDIILEAYWLGTDDVERTAVVDDKNASVIPVA